MANPSAKASHPSCSSLHTRILPSVATLNSREWFLCVVSGNQLTCSKCHELRTTGTVTTAQPMQPAVPGSTRTQEQSQAPAWYQTGFSWELAQSRCKERNAARCLGLNLHCSFYGSPALSFGMDIYGTFTQLQTAFS